MSSQGPTGARLRLQGVRPVMVAAVALLALGLSSCSSTDAAPARTAEQLQTAVQASDAWNVRAEWVWASNTDMAVRMTGLGVWSDGGDTKNWSTSWMGVTVRTTITGEKVVVEDGTTFILDSVEGRYRSTTDLFAAADPLQWAAGSKMTLTGSGRELYGRSPCSDERGRCYLIMRVVLDDKGRPSLVRAQRSTPKNTDLITYRYTYTPNTTPPR